MCPATSETKIGQRICQTYEDEDHGIVLAYPDNWYIRADENAVFVFSDESISRVTRYEEGAALFISTDTRLADLVAVVISVMLQADEDIFGDTLADITNSITLTLLPDAADSER